MLWDAKKAAAAFLFIGAFLAVKGESNILDVTVRSVLLTGVLLTYSPIPAPPKLV